MSEEPFGENVEINENYFEEEIPQKSIFSKKNFLFFMLGILILLLIILFGFLLTNIKASINKEEKEIMISEINCTFYVIDAPTKIKILNENFKNNSNIILKINGIEQNFSKNIYFENNSTNEIQIFFLYFFKI